MNNVSIEMNNKVNNIYYGFWDSKERISDIQLTQIKLWAKSLLFFHKNVNIYLYTNKLFIPKNFSSTCYSF